jgi:hypothetical protein
MVRHFSKPADIWANAPAATTLKQAGRLVFALVGKWRSSASAALAAAFKQLSMHMHNSPNTGLFMQ